MNRAQLYNRIVSFNLQDKVKSKYGKNYTQCTNVQLEEVIDSAAKIKEPISSSSSPFNKLVDILAKKKILLKSEVDAIMKA